MKLSEFIAWFSMLAITALTILLILYAFLKQSWPLAKRTLLFWTGCFSIYSVLLIIVSLNSKETIMPKKETYHFCGMYLDCHLGAYVQDTSILKNIGELKAKNSFNIVKLRISSNAKSEDMQLGEPEIIISGTRGELYNRNIEAEKEWEKIHIILKYRTNICGKAQ